MGKSTINIIYDMDDVLNDLNDVVFRELGLSLPRYYELREHKEYSSDALDKIFEKYRDINVFYKTALCNGALDIIHLEDTPGVKVWIHTVSYTKEIADYKYKLIHSGIPGFSMERLLLPIGHKKPLDFADYVIEDSYMNLYRYKNNSTKILVDKTYNQESAYSEYKITGRLVRCSSLEDVNQWLDRDIKKRKGFI